MTKKNQVAIEIPPVIPPISQEKPNIDSCCICLEPLKIKLKKLKCNHNLHLDCYENYIISQKRYHQQNQLVQTYSHKILCPMCRSLIIELPPALHSNNEIEHQIIHSKCLSNIRYCILIFNVLSLLLVLCQFIKALYNWKHDTTLAIHNIAILIILSIFHLLYTVFFGINMNINILRILAVVIFITYILSAIFVTADSDNTIYDNIVVSANILNIVLFSGIHFTIEIRKCYSYPNSLFRTQVIPSSSN